MLARDTEQDVLVYSIQTVTEDSRHFMINSSTGVITIAEPINREVDYSLQFYLVVNIVITCIESLVSHTAAHSDRV